MPETLSISLRQIRESLLFSTGVRSGGGGGGGVMGLHPYNFFK